MVQTSKAPVGSKFGKWTVLARAESRHGIRWLCRCECGKEAVLRSNYVKYRAGSCKSCALRDRPTAKGSSSKIWRGCGEISGHYWFTIKRSAIARNHEISISIQDAWLQFLNQNRKCALSGVDIVFGEHQTASLDRIDSTKGYIPGNVQWVHKVINLMKNKLPQDEFIEWCRLVSNQGISVLG